MNRSKRWKTIVLLSCATQTCWLNGAYSQEVQRPPSHNTAPNLTPVETQTLLQLLKACDSSVTACKKASDDKDALIQNQDQDNKALTQRVAELEKEQSKPSNSKTFWFVAGMLTTALTVYMVKK